MRCDDVNAAARFGNAMQFGDKGHYIGNVFEHMATDDLVEFVISKGVGNDAQIVNDIRLGSGIRINPDRARVFVLAATDVKNSLGWLRLKLLR